VREIRVQVLYRQTAQQKATISGESCPKQVPQVTFKGEGAEPAEKSQHSFQDIRQVAATWLL